MREIILETLNDIATNCGTSNNCQINFGAESARIMIADKLELALKNHVLMLMEKNYQFQLFQRQNIVTHNYEGI